MGSEGSPTCGAARRARRAAAFSRASQAATTSGSLISSVTTVKRVSACEPKVVIIGMSAASRPREIKMRPIRGRLCRGSKVTTDRRERLRTRR